MAREQGGGAREVAAQDPQTLLAEIERLRTSLAAAESERGTLAARLARLESETQRWREEFASIEEQNAHLAQLYVTSYQLHRALDREQLLGTIQEIVANLVGCEEMALFEMNALGNGLELVRASGIDTEAFRRVATSQGIIGRVGREGRTHVSERDGTDGARPEEASLTACVPLKLRGKVVGVLAVFRLLPQKEALEPLDHELFDLLSDQAATALYYSGLHERYSTHSAVSQWFGQR